MQQKNYYKKHNVSGDCMPLLNFIKRSFKVFCLWYLCTWPLPIKQIGRYWPVIQANNYLGLRKINSKTLTKQVNSSMNHCEDKKPSDLHPVMMSMSYQPHPLFKLPSSPSVPSLRQKYPNFSSPAILQYVLYTQSPRTFSKQSLPHSYQHSHTSSTHLSSQASCPLHSSRLG